MIETAHLIAVGDEVLWGETVNTNAAWMANFLMSFGVRPTLHCVVPDAESAIGQAVHQATEAADLTVVMGGLGPTADDRTLDAIATLLNRDITIDPRVFDHIGSRHGHAAGWQNSIRRQARTIAGATIWMNPRGQAPGQLIAVNGRYLVLLPGPPRELQGIAETDMSPWLGQHTRGPIHRETLSVFDLGESAVASHLWPLLEGEHPRAGIYAQPGRVDIRIETPDSPSGRILQERSRAWVKSRIPAPVFELGRESREAYLVRWLSSRGKHLALMESLTGGMICSHLVAVPGASQAVAGGVVAYTDVHKARFGVPSEVLSASGAVSEACALAMARAARDLFSTDIGISSTGFAGPDGGTEENPVGTFYVAAVGVDGEVVRRRYTPLDRQSVRRIAAHTAISAAWELLELPTLLSI